MTCHHMVLTPIPIIIGYDDNDLPIFVVNVPTDTITGREVDLQTEKFDGGIKPYEFTHI